jgi:hypothetical protein
LPDADVLFGGAVPAADVGFGADPEVLVAVPEVLEPPPPFIEAAVVVGTPVVAGFAAVVPSPFGVVVVTAGSGSVSEPTLSFTPVPPANGGAVFSAVAAAAGRAICGF